MAEALELAEAECKRLRAKPPDTIGRVQAILDMLSECSAEDGIVALTAAAGSYCEHHKLDPAAVATKMQAVMDTRRKAAEA